MTKEGQGSQRGDHTWWRHAERGSPPLRHYKSHPGPLRTPQDPHRRSPGLPRLATLATARRDHHHLARRLRLRHRPPTQRGQLPLCRLRYLGSDTDWGFALYQASNEDYNDSVLPNGSPTGTPEQALDCALGLYLADPNAWINPPKD